MGRMGRVVDWFGPNVCLVDNGIDGREWTAIGSWAKCVIDEPAE